MAQAHHHHVKGHAASDKPAFLFARVIYILCGVIAILIAVRMLLLLFNAADPAWFVNFVYTMSGLFVAPFFMILGLHPTFGAPVFEIASLVAFGFYALLGWGLAMFVLSYGAWHSNGE